MIGAVGGFPFLVVTFIFNNNPRFGKYRIIARYRNIFAIVPRPIKRCVLRSGDAQYGIIQIFFAGAVVFKFHGSNVLRRHTRLSGGHRLVA